ncbi:hypothetical protein LOTGIDRAFT_135247 [Lottia gigantea]|uniref:DOMON domain-containing protein n=1 Tax=Lottia gigantea TaxID=225164 RepID=V3YVW1_LOTGI|nr:hypothetical protein LOTGIDRAFT_135247 [Lottia gigantea]ESO82138.1 hypothetical protein LOTGIDRAFT_135247 [Lottia gigantea]
MLYFRLLCLVILLTAGAIPPPPEQPSDPVLQKSQPTEPFTNYDVLDSNGVFELFWKYNNTHITFESHVKTLGYVGFGLSPHGQMFPADVVIGWVKDGAVHFKDRHSIGHYEPIIDKSQDWILLSGKEENGKTVLKFVRKLRSCDKDDRNIEEGTTKVIFSWHPEDPQHETGLPFHGDSNKGSKSLLLLSPAQNQHLPKDAIHFDFVNKKTHLPVQDTYYHCTSYRVPKLDKKHHMVMFEPIIEKVNLEYVHHIIVYKCPAHVNYTDSMIGQQYECYEHEDRHPMELRNCMTTSFLAWAVGGGPMYIPEKVGFPLGDDDDSGVFVLETHYNNPTLKSDVIDSSGLRMHYTPTLRHYDGDMLYTGLLVDGLQIIPPGYKKFSSTGFCSSDCTNRKLSPDGINVFGVFPHSHLLGHAVRTRIIRQGEETVISDDDNYDFDYQETRLINKEIKIMPGDTIKTQCIYKSDDIDRMTFGGLSTREEMCIGFLMYYPKVEMGICASLPQYNQYIDIHTHHKDMQLYELLKGRDWKNETIRNDFQKITDESQHYMVCGSHAGYQKVCTVSSESYA